MNRAELIKPIAAETDLSKAATGRVLDVLLETIQKTVKKGDAVRELDLAPSSPRNA